MYVCFDDAALGAGVNAVQNIFIRQTLAQEGTPNVWEYTDPAYEVVDVDNPPSVLVLSGVAGGYHRDFGCDRGCGVSYNVTDPVTLEVSTLQSGECVAPDSCVCADGWGQAEGTSADCTRQFVNVVRVVGNPSDTNYGLVVGLPVAMGVVLVACIVVGILYMRAKKKRMIIDVQREVAERFIRDASKQLDLDSPITKVRVSRLAASRERYNAPAPPHLPACMPACLPASVDFWLRVPWLLWFRLACAD